MTEQEPKTEPETKSPLEEVDPASLEELFSRDPRGLSLETDIPVIVREFRRLRQAWLSAEANGAKRAPARVPKPKATDQDVEALMKELDL